MLTKRAKRCVHCLQVQYLNESGACSRCRVKHNRPQYRQSIGNTPQWRTPCGHCGRIRKLSRDPATRRRPLICSVCRGKPEVCGTPDQPCPPEATTAAPGTEAKIRIMRRRAAKGYSIFHPHDNHTPPTV